MQNLSSPRTGLGDVHHRARRHRRDRRARGRDAGVAVPQPRHDDGRAARGRAPVHPGLDHERQARAGRRHREPPAPAAVPGQHRGPDARAAAGRPRAAHRRAGALGRARRRHRACCPRRRRSTSAWTRCCRSCRRSPRTRSSRAASRTRPSSSSRCSPTLDYLAPDADRLQLPDAVVPQHLLAAERGRPQRHLAALHHRHHAAGPEQRGRAVLGAGQRPDRRPTTCTSTRTRTRRRRASRRSARRATSRSWPGRRSRPTSRARSRRAPRATRGTQLDGAAACPSRSNAFIGLMARSWPRVILFFGFTKDIPFTHGFLLKAQFQSANSIRPNSPVRIAGVEVGKVKSVEPRRGLQRRAADDGAQGLARCRSTRTRRPRSGRASSSRATSSSTSSRARRARRC